MLRVLLTIVVPLLSPTALYLAWVLLVRPAAAESGVVRWTTMPWIWLALAGAVLVATVLVLVTVHYGTSQPGTYVPPRYENGRVIPGHIDPAPRR